MGVRESVEWKMSADAAEVVKAWQAITIAQEKNLATLKKMGTEGAESGNKLSATWGKATLLCDGLSAAIGGMSGVARLATGEFERMLATQQKIAQSQQDVAGARRAMMFNLAATPEADRNRFAAGLTGLSKSTGVSERDLIVAGTDAASARGNLSLDDALAAVELSARARPDDPETMRAMAKGLLDMSHVTGSADPKENFGFLLAALDPARIENPVRFGMNVIPAMTASKEFGNSAEQTRAMAAAISSQLVDLTGEKTKTAMIQLDAGLAEFTKGRAELTNTQQRLEYVQGHPELHEAFRKKFNADTSTEPILERLATDYSGEGMGIFRSALNLPSLKEGGLLADNLIDQLNRDPQQQSSDIGRRMQSTREVWMSGESEQAREGVLRREVAEAVSMIPFGSMRFPNVEFSMQKAGDSPEAAAIRTLESYKQTLGFGSGDNFRAFSPADAKGVELLERLIQTIKDQGAAPKEITIRDEFGKSQTANERPAAALQ